MNFNLKSLLIAIFVLVACLAVVVYTYDSIKTSLENHLRDSEIAVEIEKLNSIQTAIQLGDFKNLIKQVLDPQAKFSLIPGSSSDDGGFELFAPNRTGVIDRSYHYYLPVKEVGEKFVKIKIYYSFHENDKTPSKLTVSYGNSDLSKIAADQIIKHFDKFGINADQLEMK